MKSFIVIVAALVFLVIAAMHGYRIYAGIPVIVAGTAVPAVCSWYAAGVSAVLGLLLLVFGRK